MNVNDDLISRRLAIDAAKTLLDYYGTNDISKEFADHTAERFMNRVPSAQPERKSGKWIPHEDDDGEHYGDRCSVCGEWYVMLDGRTNYCPNCGADMRGEEE